MYIYILFLLTSIFTFSCSYELEKKSHGTNKLNILEIELESGKTSKNDVITILGPPSIKNPYTKNVHYYVSQELKRNISKKDDLTKTIILEVIYDDKNILKDSYIIENKGSTFTINESLEDNFYQSRTRFNIFKEIFDNMRRRND